MAAASSGSSTSVQTQMTQDSHAEHMNRLKQLIHLVENALVNVLSQTDIALQQNAESGESGKTGDEDPHRLERYLEDFLNVSDQLEDLLESMQAAERMTALSQKYAPKPVSSTRTDISQDTQTYTDYLSIARNQISISNELQDLLADFVKSKLT
ncbi:mediator of RNA polymerase II transcription subunit 29 [Exaiptasia diaphana]|uniref:Mediator of RNA polymerase II transcription subunit 29 n=1 Tax=Exaiptasia diaphana TaxID=2652724 RepID=A0A913XB53_EXADI|nr:mediator of RNA polymerase II transcription subunit 29 [Exaiptasia diaphana]KXJ13388.1 Mediator of RNA polymerase II transcription subunit 29 [Exaiptasia diaphana]